MPGLQFLYTAGHHELLRATCSVLQGLLAGSVQAALLRYALGSLSAILIPIRLTRCHGLQSPLVLPSLESFQSSSEML